MTHKKKTPTDNPLPSEKPKKMAILTQRILNIMGHQNKLASATPPKKSVPDDKPSPPKPKR